MMEDKNFLFLALCLVAAVWGWILGNTFLRLLDVSLLGVICHYFNAAHNTKSINCGITGYFMGAFRRTLASLGGCVLAVFGIVQSGDIETLNYLLAGSAFAAGYTSDSVLNKAPEAIGGQP